MIERRKVAEGRLLGKTSKQIAEDIGRSQATVKLAWTDVRTANMIQELRSEHAPKMQEMFAKGLKTIDEMMDLRDDPTTALKAAQIAVNLPLLGTPPPMRRKEERKTRAGGYTLEELLTTYREMTSTDPGPPPDDEA